MAPFEPHVVKKSGKVANLESAAQELMKKPAFAGISHTRWATHGGPTDCNAHPHTSEDGKIMVVHNGIIENFMALKQTLKMKGYNIRSETDTELLAHLLHDVMKDGMAPDEAVPIALRRVEGTFGCVFLFADYPDLIIGARRGSPLILGIRKSSGSEGEQKEESYENEYFLASDASAIVAHTKEVIYLREDEMVIATRRGHTITSLKKSGLTRKPSIHELELDLMEIEKGGYEHCKSPVSQLCWIFVINLLRILILSHAEGDHGAAPSVGKLHARACSNGSGVWPRPRYPWRAEGGAAPHSQG